MDTDAQIRVGLGPLFRLLPFVDVVDGVNDGEEFVIVEHAVQHLLGVEVLFVAKAAEVEAGGGDHPDHRLAAGADAGLDDVVEMPIRVGVYLIQQCTVGVETVQALGVTAKRLKFVGTAWCGVVQFVAPDADVSAQQRGVLDHAHGFRVRDARLVHLGGGGVDLRAAFPIELEQVDADAGDLGGLAVFARDFFPNFAESAGAIGAHPAEGERDPELLPGRQLELLAGPFAFAVPVEQEGFERVLRVFLAEPEAALGAGFKVAVVAFDGEPGELADGNLSGQHVAAVGVPVVGQHHGQGAGVHLTALMPMAARRSRCAVTGSSNRLPCSGRARSPSILLKLGMVIAASGSHCSSSRLRVRAR